MESNQLIALVTSKFPPELNLKLQGTRVDKNWTSELFRNMIQRKIIKKYLPDSDHLGKTVDYEDECTGEALMSKDVKVNCVYCESNHIVWSNFG